MSKFILVIFPDEKKAYEASRGFRELDAEGSLTLYGLAVVGKDAGGKVSVKQATDDGPLGTGVGMLVGAMAGLLGGPAGVAIGMGSGALLGSLRDLYVAGVSGEFVEHVAQELSPGKTAVVAEVSEEWVTPLDTRMSALGGVVVREWRSDFESELASQNAAATKAELAQLKAEYQQSSEEAKGKLKARIDEIQAKGHASADKLKARAGQVEQEAGARIKRVEQQLAQAKGEARARLDRRIGELRAENERRNAKLKQAGTLLKEAFAI